MFEGKCFRFLLKSDLHNDTYDEKTKYSPDRLPHNVVIPEQLRTAEYFQKLREDELSGYTDILESTANDYDNCSLISRASDHKNALLNNQKSYVHNGNFLSSGIMSKEICPKRNFQSITNVKNNQRQANFTNVEFRYLEDIPKRRNVSICYSKQNPIIEISYAIATQLKTILRKHNGKTAELFWDSLHHRYATASQLNSVKPCFVHTKERCCIIYEDYGRKSVPKERLPSRVKKK